MYTMCNLNVLAVYHREKKCHDSSEGIPGLIGQLCFTTVQIHKGSPTKYTPLNRL